MKDIMDIEEGRYVIDSMVVVGWLGINHVVRIRREGEKYYVDGLFYGKNADTEVPVGIVGFGDEFEVIEEWSGRIWHCRGSLSMEGDLVISMNSYGVYGEYYWDYFLRRFVEQNCMDTAEDHRTIRFVLRKELAKDTLYENEYRYGAHSW